MHALSAVANDEDRNDHDMIAPRQAAAGGSGGEPPRREPQGAEIIRFPEDRARYLTEEERQRRSGPDQHDAAEVSAANIGAVWAAWMTGVLSTTSKQLGPQLGDH